MFLLIVYFFIRNHIIAYDIADKFKKKYDEEKEVDLTEFNIFEEDISTPILCIVCLRWYRKR